MTIEIRPESPNQFREVEALVREAFWNVYTPGCTEHYLLHVMRRSPNFVCELSLVVLEDKAIVGQIAFTRAGLRAMTVKTGKCSRSGRLAFIRRISAKASARA